MDTHTGGMGWPWISSPPVPQPAPARILAPEPPDDSFPPDPPADTRVWIKYRAYDLTSIGGWRWAQFDTPAQRDSWRAIWREDFEIVLRDTPPSDAT
jgi:hypothetical protein